MGPSEKAFNQVRNILGKLDRNIDQLRTQRARPADVRGPSAPAPQAIASHHGPHTLIGVAPGQGAAPRSQSQSGIGLASEQRSAVPGSHAGAAPASPRPSSQYGRATPIPPSGK